MTDSDTPSDQKSARQSRDTVVKQFDWAATPPSVAVVRVISAVTNTEPTGYKPLSESIDLDAMDELLLCSTDTVELSVTHMGLPVAVRSDGTVVAYPD